MANDVWVWHYELQSAAALNSVSNRTAHPGALIRCGDGFGCLHPWPELGDAPLDVQLKSIVDERPEKLASVSLHCAEIDGKARKEGVSLFDQFSADIPVNHWLYLEGDGIESIKSSGFTTVKLKIGPKNPQTELIEKIAKEKLRIRLDANSSFAFADFTQWWQDLPGNVKQQIEFVEDPIPWSWWNWKFLEQSGVQLALDRELENRYSVGSWAIMKPAVDNDPVLLSWIERRELQVAVTSYMDHPLGQMWAAFGASQMNQRNTELTGECGLLTHRCFAANEFSEQLVVTGNVLQKPEGKGLGFDDTLEKLPWKRLS